MTMPEAFLKELRKNKKAEAIFKGLNKTNLFFYWISTSDRKKTRDKRKAYEGNY